MAEIVENELRAHLTSPPSFIQDTTDFLNKLRRIQQPLPEGTYCSAWMSRHSTSIPTDDVLAKMDTVLDNNTVTFNGIHYIQTEGTAIGSNLGMNYASTYMGSWEKELLPIRR